MCILLVSTSHPTYPFVLLNNRDEYLSRPTAPATWWQEPHSHVLGGRDLQRSVQGTWLGITRRGRLAVLTNFREEGAELIEGARSRGEIPNAFLTAGADSKDESPEAFAARLIEEEGFQGVGGFSLAFGNLRRIKLGDQAGPVAFISNRTPDVKDLKHSGLGTWGLSNSHYGDRAWPKVVNGENLLDKVIEESVQAKQPVDQFIESCFKVLSTDTLPKRESSQDWQVLVRELRHSIFIPAIGGDAAEPERPADEIAAAKDKVPVTATSGVYGTQKQTVILVDQEGKVLFVERTLYDQNAQPVAQRERDRRFEFDIEGWDDE